MKKVCSLPSVLCPLPARLCRRPPRAPYLLALTRATGKAVLGLLLIGLAAGNLCAQEPDPSALTNVLNVMTQVQTNDAMQVEDLVSALRSVTPEEPAPEDTGATNGASANPGNEMSPGADQSYHRPSGRESRSRWSSRQRTNGFGSDVSPGPLRAGTATNGAPVSLEYSAFRKVVENNIFDPNRHPSRGPYVLPDRGRDPVYFTLVGTMSYEEGTFAFFSGSSSFYQRALKCSETIGDYKVARIDADAVQLVHDTNQVELRIGMQMRQDDNGAWAASEAPTTYTVNDFQPASTSSAPGTAASSGAESNEILKRLMEKREKE